MIDRSLSSSVIIHFLIIFAALFENTAMAEDAPPAMLEAIVIAASPIPFTLSKTTNNTNIINREMIEARQATSVVDLLRLVPGLHIDQAGGVHFICVVVTPISPWC